MTISFVLFCFSSLISVREKSGRFRKGLILPLSLTSCDTVEKSLMFWDLIPSFVKWSGDGSEVGPLGPL